MNNMTIREAIARLDALVPNAYSPENKVKWLSDLDGKIKKEIIDTHEGSEAVTFEGYTEDNLDAELLVPPEYDELYMLWLEAKIDFSNKEYNRYNNSVVAFNTAYQAFDNYYNRTHLPIQTKLKFF